MHVYVVAFVMGETTALSDAHSTVEDEVTAPVASWYTVDEVVMPLPVNLSRPLVAS